MKKILLLPLFAAMALVSQVQAVPAECTSSGKTITYLCAWTAGTTDKNCWKLQADPSPSEGPPQTCSGRATDCPTLFQMNSGTSLPPMNTPASDGYNCSSLTPFTGAAGITFDEIEIIEECKNAAGKLLFCDITWGCTQLETQYGQVGAAGATCGGASTPKCTCAQLINNCPANQTYVDVNKSAIGTGEGKKCGADGGGVLAGGGTPSSSSVGGSTPSSSSTGGTPIISHNNAPVVGLNVVSFARSLKIASGKDATVSLFDMNGRQVFGQKVFSGTTTISLEAQKQGVYYVVVRSGAQKQTLKVVLK